MNLFSAFQSEVFRPLVTLLIPGALGASSWIVVLFWEYPHLKNLAFTYRIETAVILFLVIPALGLLIEDLGSRFEYHRDAILDRNPPPEEKQGAHTRDWYAYLRKTYGGSDPIGRGYVKSVVLRLKFELGIAIASMITMAGIAVLYFSLGLPGSRASVFVVLLAVLSRYEWWEAKESHELLSITRRELLKDTQALPPVDQSKAAGAS